MSVSVSVSVSVRAGIPHGFPRHIAHPRPRVLYTEGRGVRVCGCGDVEVGVHGDLHCVGLAFPAGFPGTPRIHRPQLCVRRVEVSGFRNKGGLRHVSLRLTFTCLSAPTVPQLKPIILVTASRKRFSS